MTETAVRPQQSRRADATRNRERIVEAARDLLVEIGPDVPLDAIAGRAGVGNATVYRHFANRSELLHQVTLFSMALIAEEAEQALSDPGDPFDALRAFVHRAADERLGALCSYFSSDVGQDAPGVRQAIGRIEDAVEALMARARDAGQLRADVALGDLMVAVTQLSRPVAGTVCDAATHYQRRHLELFIDGLHTPARSTLPGTAVTLGDLERSGP